IAFFAHSSAATCAANGVALRDPLKPEPPALAHASTPPAGPVIGKHLLVHGGRPRTTADWTLFFTFFLPVASRASWQLSPALRSPSARCARPWYFLVRVCFLPATVFTGPLRVRALVCVRCPRTGSPRRWRRPR